MANSSNNGNMDMATLMNMLSKMDKNKVEAGLNQVSKMLNSKEADEIIDKIRGSRN